MGLRGLRARRVPEATAKRPRREGWRKQGLSRAERVVKFIESLPVTKGILAGRKMKLLTHQREFISAVYGEQAPIRLAIQSAPRGNGKTGLLAGLCLAHLLGPEAEPRGEVYAAAIDRQQAGLLFNEIVAIVEAVPTFTERVNVQRFKKIVEVLDGDGAGSRFETLTADVRRGHGLSPSLFVYDELAQSKTGDLLDTLITAQGKRTRSLGIVISTQAADDLHPLSVLIDDALRGLDRSLFVQLIAAPPDADPFAETTWTAVNPALGHFLDAVELRTQAERAQRVPTFEAKWRNLRLNQRVDTEERWLPVDAWKACSGPLDLDALAGSPCFGGLDLGSTRDLTAFALYWPDAGALAVWAWCPADTLSARELSDRAPFRVWARQGQIEPTGGRATDKRRVVRRLAELTARFTPTAIAFDRWGMAEIERLLSEEGITLPLREFGQGFKDMAPATAAFETRVLSGHLRHGANPLLTWALSNVAIERDAAGNAKPNKRRSHERIDPIVASIMAVGMSAQEPIPQQSVYANRGVILI
jgi:phage terminase large subunit-like protein